jgi:hypothetical protein
MAAWLFQEGYMERWSEPGMYTMDYDIIKQSARALLCGHDLIQFFNFERGFWLGQAFHLIARYLECDRKM